MLGASLTEVHIDTFKAGAFPSLSSWVEGRRDQRVELNQEGVLSTPYAKTGDMQGGGRCTQGRVFIMATVLC